MKRRVLEYNAIFQQEDEGGFSVWIPSLPGCTSQGETFEEAKRNIQKAIELYLGLKLFLNDVVTSSLPGQ